MWEKCNESRPEAGQDPDVIGLGTLIACAGSACFAIACLLIQYLFFYLPQDDDDQQDPHAANPIDVLFVGGFRTVLSYLGIGFGWVKRPRRPGRWQEAFDQCMLALGDVQLAIGFAVLAYGYVSLSGQGLSVYHWWLIVGLCWFSVVTSLASISYLRTYFANRDAAERRWRIFLLILLIIVVSFSMVPIYQVREKLANEPDRDARCKILFTTNVLCYMPGYGANLDTPYFKSAATLFGIVLGVCLAVTGILRLYERPSSVIFKWRDHFRGEMQQSFFGDGDTIITCIRCEQRHMLLIVRPVLALWLVLRVYVDLLNSILTEVLCTSALFAWVTVRFIDVLRFDGFFETDPHLWPFGQIIALASFVAPFGSLASCLCGTIGGLFFRSHLRSRPEPPTPEPRTPDMRQSGWFSHSAKRTPTEQLTENGDDQHPGHPRLMAEEDTALLGGKDGSDTADGDTAMVDDRDPSENDEVESTKSSVKGSYTVLLSPRFVIAFPLAGFSNLLHLVLLLALPKLPGYPTTTDVLWRTIFWYVVYQPLLLFAFFLAGMIVEERVMNERRMRFAYQIIATLSAGLSAAAIFDTLYGLGGIPMSYIGMGALGLVLLIYLLYGLVARPGPLAKGKGVSHFPRDQEGTDVEEGAPLLRNPMKRMFPIYPVRKQKRWHGPSRRPQIVRVRRNYGTID
ncbi:hypothetical protein GGS23DRAFT_469623 [Durotheca rogersii]|uniref:uncharacterized protein n=1 Tax=Durotheca rogersii TaxID=419775 RepID=UPI00221EA3A9|nr:uncharacterized protein GGS23DRAFT_469623 [Durotheca rogersii]KAI5864937.1 hypothetical protein GGS23DRAFT_469623 [Durotheca rogersii]